MRLFSFSERQVDGQCKKSLDTKGMLPGKCSNLGFLKVYVRDQQNQVTMIFLSLVDFVTLDISAKLFSNCILIL